MGHKNQQHVIYGQCGPPENEIPAVIAPGVEWREYGAVVAIPSLLVYATGTELLIMARFRDQQPRDNEQAHAIREALRGLSVNGRQVGLLGGDNRDHGFTYRAWAALLDDVDSLTIALVWRGINLTEHQVTGVREAVSRVSMLWQEP